VATGAVVEFLKHPDLLQQQMPMAYPDLASVTGPRPGIEGGESSGGIVSGIVSAIKSITIPAPAVTATTTVYVNGKFEPNASATTVIDKRSNALAQ
jgi:hypothetical protein